MDVDGQHESQCFGGLLAYLGLHVGLTRAPALFGWESLLKKRFWVVSRVLQRIMKQICSFMDLSSLFQIFGSGSVIRDPECDSMASMLSTRRIRVIYSGQLLFFLLLTNHETSSSSGDMTGNSKWIPLCIPAGRAAAKQLRKVTPLCPFSA